MSGQWVWRLAWASLACMAVGGLIVRFSLLPGRLGVLLVALGMVVAIAALAASGRPLWRGTTHWRLWAGLAMAAVMLALPLSALLYGRAYPPIHDISTDLASPPQFEAVLAIRPDWANSLARSEPENLAELQAEHYPALVPARFNLPPEAVFALAHQLAKNHPNWHIVAADREAGRIEGWTASHLMGYRDDFVIRIRGDAGGSVADMRSVSRVGVSDLGVNAARIENYLNRLKRAAKSGTNR